MEAVVKIGAYALVALVGLAVVGAMAGFDQLAGWSCLGSILLALVLLGARIWFKG